MPRHPTLGAKENFRTLEVEPVTVRYKLCDSGPREGSSMGEGYLLGGKVNSRTL
jgi:hypothetical protein